jgi:hypothetical protein
VKPKFTENDGDHPTLTRWEKIKCKREKHCNTLPKMGEHRTDWVKTTGPVNPKEIATPPLLFRWLMRIIGVKDRLTALFGPWTNIWGS